MITLFQDFYKYSSRLFFKVQKKRSNFEFGERLLQFIRFWYLMVTFFRRLT